MDVVKRFREQWDRACAIVFVIAGLVALLLGYLGVSDTEFVAAQIPYIVSGGLLGLFLLGAAGVLWLSSDLRDEWVKLESMDARLDRMEQVLLAARSDTEGIEESATPARPAAGARTESAPARARRLAKARG
jgi:hypothetical protein